MNAPVTQSVAAPVAPPVAASQSLRVVATRPALALGQAVSDVVIVCDESGSMADPCIGESSKINAVRQAAAQFARTKSKLDPRGRLSIVGFDDTVRTHIGLTLAVDLAAIRPAIDALSTHGSTNIEAGLSKAHTALTKGGNGQTRGAEGPRVCVLLTDGYHNSGGGDPVATADAMKRDGIEIYVVGFGASPSDVDGRAPQIASPGKYLFCRDLASLLGQFQQISQRTSIRRQTP